MRVIVVGGGVIGLLTTMECVSAGAEVILFDQSDIPNPVGASYDRHRIVRALRVGNARLTRDAVDARERWIALERQVGTQFYRNTGALSVLVGDMVAPSLASLGAAGARACALSRGELTSRFRHIRFPTATAGILEEDAGIVLADVALESLASWLRAQPLAQLCPNRRVVAVDIDDRAVEFADGTAVYGDRLVVAAGPWSRDLLGAPMTAGLRLHRQTMLSCEVPVRVAAKWDATPVIPTFGDTAGSWLVPPVGETPLKLSANSACRMVDRIDDHDTPARWRRHLVEQFRRLIPAFTGRWVLSARDSYYLAEAGTGRPRLAAMGVGAGWAYCACGGTSFTFAPLIARTLAHRVAAPDRTGGPSRSARSAPAGPVL